MKSKISPFGPGLMTAATRAGIKALSFCALLASASAFAAAPPALTNIGNTASASFTDSSGNPTQVSSNPVSTTVQQVGTLTIDGHAGAVATVVNTKTTTQGSTVYAPHLLTNTGNGTDNFTISAVGANAGRFSKIEIFADDGSGNPSGAYLCTATTGACVITVPVSVAGSGGNYKFVVAYSIPSSATAVATPYETATVTAAPVPASLPMYGTVVSAAVKDEVNLTSAAAFSMNKNIGTPLVAGPGGNQWPTPNASGLASTSSTCPTNWTAQIATSPQAGCTYTVYTLTFANNGLAAGKFVFEDVLPTGLTYVTGSAVWSSAGGTALGDGTGNDDPAGISYKATSTGFTAVVTQIPQGQTQTLSFVVLVNNLASTGVGATANIAAYNSADAPTATIAQPNSLPSRTGTSGFTVTGNYAVAIGSVNSTSVTARDPTPGAPDVTGTSDNTIVSSAAPGSTVRFSQRVYNVGTAVDTFDLKVDQSSFPAGTNFLLYASDGFTPLNDTGSLNNIPDTGPVAAGQYVTVVVAAILPTSLQTFGPVSYKALVTATSVNDPTKKDATGIAVSSVFAGMVDLTNTAAGTTGLNGDVGPGPSSLPTTTISTVPGVAAAFNLYVKNNEATAARDFILTSSGSPTFSTNGLLPGWTIRFIAGANGNCASGSSITSTGSISAASQAAVTACVTPAANQGPIAGVKVYFKVTASTVSAAGVTASDIKTDAVTVTASVAASYAATLVGSNTGQAAAGGTVIYSHTLTNTGSQNCGAYTMTATLSPADIAAGWKASVLLDVDNDGQLGATDTPVSGQVTGVLAPGALAARKYLVRVDAPSQAALNSTSTVTLTSDFVAGPTSCGTQAVIDITTITTGTVRVQKTQALDSACAGTPDATPVASSLQVKPGKCIFYRVIATNQGIASISNLTITDTAPAYTSLNTPQSSSSCAASAATGSTSGTFAFTKTTSAVTCGGVNVVNPGGTVTLQYSVMVDN